MHNICMKYAFFIQDSYRSFWSKNTRPQAAQNIIEVWCYYRVGSEEEFRSSGFENILITPMGVINAYWEIQEGSEIIEDYLGHADGGSVPM